MGTPHSKRGWELALELETTESFSFLPLMGIIWACGLLLSVMGVPSLCLFLRCAFGRIISIREKGLEYVSSAPGCACVRSHAVYSMCIGSAQAKRGHWLSCSITVGRPLQHLILYGPRGLNPGLHMYQTITCRF